MSGMLERFKRSLNGKQMQVTCTVPTVVPAQYPAYVGVQRDVVKFQLAFLPNMPQERKVVLHVLDNGFENRALRACA